MNLVFEAEVMLLALGIQKVAFPWDPFGSVQVPLEGFGGEGGWPWGLRSGMSSLEKCSVHRKEDFLTLLLNLESALYYGGGTESVKSYVEYIFIFYHLSVQKGKLA